MPKKFSEYLFAFEDAENLARFRTLQAVTDGSGDDSPARLTVGNGAWKNKAQLAIGGAALLVSQERFERSASSSAGKRSNPLSYWDAL